MSLSTEFVVAAAWLATVSVVVAVVYRRVAPLRRRLRRAEATASRAAKLVERGEERAALRVELLRRAGELGRAPRLPLELLGEDGEDVLALRVLDPLADSSRAGRFVECGAFDGLLRSVTYPFEALGWSGLLVEPQPEEAARCEKARPHSTVLPVALVPLGGPSEVEIEVFEAHSMVRTASFQHGASGDHFDVGDVRSTRVSVPSITMDDALERAFGEAGRREGLDLVVLDVEGAELDVLAGFSLELWRPRLLIIEDLSGRTDSRVADRVTASGYVRAARVGRNDAYVRQGDQTLIQRCRIAGDPGW